MATGAEIPKPSAFDPNLGPGISTRGRDIVALFLLSILLRIVADSGQVSSSIVSARRSSYLLLTDIINGATI